LHVFTASLEQAQTVLSAALQAGFRESGALNLVSSGSEPATPIVGIRSMGLALESIVGFEYEGKPICMLPGYQIRNLLQVGNERFKENTKRIERFRTLLKELSQAGGDVGAKRKAADGGEWEDAEARRARKRAEGLKKAQKVRAMKEVGVQDRVDNGVEGMPDIGFLDEENT
jgi:tRNA wybutosine-synthesizing protein 3